MERTTVMKKAAGLFAGLLLATLGATANAAVANYTFNGTVTSIDPILTGLGVPNNLSFTLTLDSTNPDANAATGAYASTDPSNLSATILIPLAGNANVTSSGTTDWSASGTIVGQGLPVPFSMSLTGSGLTPDQITPDFSSFTGTFTADLTQVDAAVHLGLSNMTVSGTIDSINVSAVPLPAAAWLMGSALLGLAGISRRRKS